MLGISIPTLLFSLFLSGMLAFAVGPAAAVPKGDVTADHRKFEVLKQPFASAPEVTKACLGCHTEAGKQIHETIHWTWEFDHPTTGQRLGKRHVLNNFCGAIASNEPRCTSCHAGYGYKDASFDFSDETKIDCLVCHEQTGTYRKFPPGAGHPVYEPKKFAGKTWLPPDLNKVAQSVGQPTRENCGVCHFFGGGGNGVKHGDMDASLVNPGHALDVHMDADGLNFSCQECHAGSGHRVVGSRYATTARDTEGQGKPGLRREAATCESCHGMTPHPYKSLASLKLDDHIDKIACQTCHIPEMARGGRPTLTYWDWSAAGRKGPNGEILHEENARGWTTYSTKKGRFDWRENVEPTYAWFNGEVVYTMVGEKIDPTSVVPINTFGGDHDDPHSRIWPFKVVRGKQAYDIGNQSLVYAHLFGKDDKAYWKAYDWDKAIGAAMAAGGLPFSGEHDFVETEMYWPITHMVAPAEEALACEDCHSRDGRFGNLETFYVPARDRSETLDRIGLIALGIAGAGVTAHGLARIFVWRRRK